MGEPVRTKKNDKKARMLAAARKVMSQYGFANTTVSLVAEEAEVSRGLIHYHFNNKEDMLAQVLRENMEVTMEDFNVALASCTTAEQLSKCVAQGYRELFLKEPAYFQLFLEGLVAARNSEVVRSEIYCHYEIFRESLSEHIEKLVDAGAITTRLSPKGLGILVTAMVDGFGGALATAPEIAQDQEYWDYLETGIVKLIV